MNKKTNLSSSKEKSQGLPYPGGLREKQENPPTGLVVIGGGITGLSTAIAWALTHNVTLEPVTVLEKQPIVGGCVTSFRREGYLFDTTQIIPDCRDVLEYLGISVELERFTGDYCKIFKVYPSSSTASPKVLEIPSGFEAFFNRLQQQYPFQREALKHFMEYSRGIYQELFHLKTEPNLFQLLQTLIQCPKLLRVKDDTFSQYLDRFGINDPDLRETLGVFAIFGGLSSQRIAALMPVAALTSTLEGAYRPKQGFIHLPLAMRRRLEELGGKVRCNSPVKRILVEKGVAQGVELEKGEVIRSQWVVTTVDPKIAVERLIGRNILEKANPAYVRKVDEVRMSVSSMTISLGLDEGFDLHRFNLSRGYNVITTGGDTFETLLQAAERGELVLDPNRFHFAVISPSLTIGGKPTLILRVVPMAMGDWAELRSSDYSAYTRKKQQVADFYIALAEQYLIPGLSSAIRYRDIATPATFARYIGSPTGSNYDMAPYPDNFGRKRLSLRTPIRGLLQPKFSHGLWPSLQAGLQAVDLINGGKILGGNSRYRASIF